MSMLALGDIDLFYECHGPQLSPSPRPPLILVAGLASDSQSWGPALVSLCKDRPVVVLDNRGCGRTTPQDGPNSIERMADDCIALADHLGIDRFDLLGHSMGGFIALDCALRHPRRVGRLILANSAPATSARDDNLFGDWARTLSAGNDPALWFRNFFYWIFTPAFFEQAGLFEAGIQLALAYPYPQSPAGFEGQVAAMRGFDRRERLAGIRARTLVLCSERDMIFPAATALADFAPIPDVSTVLAPAQAHALPVESPDVFLGLVEDFLT